MQKQPPAPGRSRGCTESGKQPWPAVASVPVLALRAHQLTSALCSASGALVLRLRWSFQIKAAVIAAVLWHRDHVPGMLISASGTSLPPAAPPRPILAQGVLVSHASSDACPALACFVTHFPQRPHKKRETTAAQRSCCCVLSQPGETGWVPVYRRVLAPHTYGKRSKNEQGGCHQLAPFAPEAHNEQSRHSAVDDDW